MAENQTVNKFSNLLNINNLSNNVLQNREDLITFCFLLYGVPEKRCRKIINCSRITEKFWKHLKSLEGFINTFNNFTERELNNTFKYIIYLPACQKFEIDLVLKTFFYLRDEKLINENQSIAEIGKTMLFWLNKIKDSDTKENISLEDVSATTTKIMSYNLYDLYINIQRFEDEVVSNCSSLNLKENDKYINNCEKSIFGTIHKESCNNLTECITFQSSNNNNQNYNFTM